jgi:hypothetical protein
MSPSCRPAPQEGRAVRLGVGRLSAALAMLLALGLAAPLAAAPDARERLAAERSAVDARFAEARAACQTQFFVNDCQEAALQQRRMSLDGLRQQQLLLDDARRRERAAQRTQQQLQARAPAPSVPASSPVLRPPRQAAAAATVAAPSAARASGEAGNPHQHQQAFDQRQQAARAHQRAVDERNARLDAARPPAAGLPLPAASAASR